MRRKIAMGLIVPLLASCWRPGPGERDPTRYPWDQPAPKTASNPEAKTEGVYCVVALQPTALSGVIVGGGKLVSPECAEMAARMGNTRGPTATIQPLPPSPAVTPHSPPTNDYLQRCDALAPKLVELQRRYDLKLAGAVGQMSRAAWEGGGRGDWSNIRWALAWNATCSIGYPSAHKVTLYDEQSRVLGWQMISTVNECHGDHATLSPDQTEYRC